MGTSLDRTGMDFVDSVEGLVGGSVDWMVGSSSLEEGARGIGSLTKGDGSGLVNVVDIAAFHPDQVARNQDHRHQSRERR